MTALDIFLALAVGHIAGLILCCRHLHFRIKRLEKMVEDL